MLSLFVLSTQEGWPSHMYIAIDADDDAPRKDSNFVISIYYLSFVFFGSAFVLNLFTGVLFFRFIKSKE